ncbi:MAG: helix-turn-helix transcriptional regulator, partial [Actinobacteria bacterium]|nr:helix-turn-helix transcriptional regulator [Actinomycetota bacterium]
TYSCSRSYSLHFLGQLAWFEGDLPLARRYLDECRQINLELGDRRAIAYTLLVRAGVDTDAGSYAAAHEGLAECLAMFNGLGEMWGLPFAVFALAVLLAAEGRHEVALRLEGSAAAMREHVGDPLPPAFKARTDSYLQMARRALGEAASAAALAEGRAMPLPQVIAEALASAGAFRPAAGPAVAAGAGELAPLSKREVAVAALIARGLTNRRIAGELAIGEGTVANHVERILRKLGLSSRARIAVWAVERQLSNQ